MPTTLFHDRDLEFLLYELLHTELAAGRQAYVIYPLVEESEKVDLRAKKITGKEAEAALGKAWDEGRPDPIAAFDRLGRAYLDFAKREPAFYSAMFEAGVPPESSPELRAAGDRAFAVLRNASEILVARIPAHLPARHHAVPLVCVGADAVRARLIELENGERNRPVRSTMSVSAPAIT